MAITIEDTPYSSQLEPMTDTPLHKQGLNLHLGEQRTLAYTPES